MLRRFVRIQDEDGTDVRVNPHQVESIESTGEDGGTLVHMQSGKTFASKMSVEELVKQFEKSAGGFAG